MGRSAHNAVEFRHILHALTEEARHLALDTLRGTPLVTHLGSNTRILQQLERTARVPVEATPIESSESDNQFATFRQYLTNELATTFGIPAEQLEDTGRGREWARQEILGDFPMNTRPMENLHEHALQEIQRREDESWGRLYDSNTMEEVRPHDPLDARFVRRASQSDGYYSEFDEPPAPAPKRVPSKPREEARTISFEPGQRLIDTEG